jgi:hypothetical protein
MGSSFHDESITRTRLQAEQVWRGLVYITATLLGCFGIGIIGLGLGIILKPTS